MGRFSTGEETTLACHKDRPRRHGRVGHIDNGQRNTTDGLDGRHNRRAKSAFIVIAPVYIGRGYPLSVLGKGGLLWAAKSRAFRESFSEGPLGLKSKRKRPHAVMCVKGLSSVQQWIESLPRSQRTTLAKQVDQSFAKAGITVITIPDDPSARPSPLRFEHFLVVLDHQRRVLFLPIALLVASLRFLVARIMVGTVDEFRINGRLVAWSQCVWKGDTIRGMWFYQRSSVSKCLIWFYTLRLGVSRALALDGCEWLDLGPSSALHIKDLKVKFGFQDTARWADEGWCDCSGPYHTIPSQLPIPALGGGGSKQEGSVGARKVGASGAGWEEGRRGSERGGRTGAGGNGL